ncbi:hypothetical protein [Sandaracinus amylolyticus]|uniref:AMIN domain-containing protein n=1 Tax=Sandaracinus amylolyticus TaxID=927083 RepID=A0A0F6SF61_9BACT|nr:hypothetical protein [Sandaracinus amylolyticus]AKF06384.1 hypothetical protein DB32_003533 [Sandaracinus amylolyticus]
MRRLLRLALACALLLVVPAAARAQERPASGYEGVVPGGAQPPPAAGRLARRGAARRARAAILTWPGFQMQADGSSRFFVQTTAAVTTRVHTTPERVEIVFPNTGIHLANSARWLETQHFQTPVRRARLERRGRDMVLVMYMRASVAPQVTSGVGDGYHYTYVDFAPGEYAPPQPALAPAPQGGVSIVSGGDAPPTAPSEAPPTMTPEQERALDEERPPVRGPTPKR